MPGDRHRAPGRFERWVQAQGLALYPAQADALIEIVSGSNVIVNTPTGSGKSLIAVGAHFTALAGGQRSFYTAPIVCCTAASRARTAGSRSPIRSAMSSAWRRPRPQLSKRA